MIKYPRTQHIEGSRLQPGDHDLEQVGWATLEKEALVIEEKIDGANSGVSFSDSGDLLLQSRGHYLTGGAREKHFNLLKTWAISYRSELWGILGKRFVMYGEWAYAKHTVYYDRLPHYFLEFDIFDLEQSCFLDTDRRHEMLQGSPVVSVPVLCRGRGEALPRPEKLVGPSLYKSARWKESLRTQAEKLGLNVEQVIRETDQSQDAEGLYIKVENGGIVTERLKWVRHSFLTTVVESESHWLNRPIIPNALAESVDIFGGERR